MPELWVYVLGGIVVAIIALLIGYNLFSNIMNYSQKQDVLKQFSDLCQNINTVCTQEVGNFVVKKYTLPWNDRVVYATDDTSKILPTVVDKIKNQEISSGKNICLQFKDEQEVRCCPEPPRQFSCRVKMPHIGLLPEHEDIWVRVRKILTGQVSRDYEACIRKVSWQDVSISFDRECEEIIQPTTTLITTTTSSTVPTTTTIQPMCKLENLVNSVNVNSMFETIQYLAQESRVFGSNWNRQTADYIADKLRSYGLENVHFEDFTFSGRNGRNVVGEIGSGTQVIIVAGGHRDSVSTSPGAVDNAAGTATVIEAARVLASCKDSIKQYKIRFVLFDAEEYGLVGSKAYAELHVDKMGENTGEMLNFDCLGYKNANGLVIYRTSDTLSNAADECCNLLKIDCTRVFSAGASSDQVPFYDRGINVLFAINKVSGHPCGSCYHQACDDLTKIGSTQLGWAGKLATCILAKLYLK